MLENIVASVHNQQQLAKPQLLKTPAIASKSVQSALIIATATNLLALS